MFVTYQLAAMVVAEMLQWGAPLPFILLVVMLGFYESANKAQDCLLEFARVPCICLSRCVCVCVCVLVMAPVKT